MNESIRFRLDDTRYFANLIYCASLIIHHHNCDEGGIALNVLFDAFCNNAPKRIDIGISHFRSQFRNPLEWRKNGLMLCQTRKRLKIAPRLTGKMLHVMPEQHALDSRIIRLSSTRSEDDLLRLGMNSPCDNLPRLFESHAGMLTESMHR